MTQGNPPSYAGMQPGLPAAKKGFPVWLIVLLSVLGVVVVMVGVMGALAYHGFTKYIRAAKTAEAKEGVGRIAKDAATAYDVERSDPSGGYFHALCASASSPVPANAAQIRG